jgi:FtsP/CotA-like multicopper oxidase with cupredoxin domain
MRYFTAFGAALLGLSMPLVNASPLKAEPLGFSPAPATALEKKQTTGCFNGPSTRNCWIPGFDSSTDMYTRWPNTGRIVTYDLSITNTTCNPDGQQSRVCMLINNQYPGPTIQGNWGDTFRITVRNKLQHNGTSIHWHGLRQLNSNTEDGVNGVTECALAPGDSKTYTFRATEYGTSWYHSHFSAQYGDGVVGALVINGPATANYDLDLGSYALSDWYHITAYQAARQAFLSGQLLAGPPQADNILINGTNKGTTNTTGSYNNVKLQPGRTHRLRLINTSLDAALRVSLDGHPFTVIANDFVPVVPYTTNYLLIGIGQRYDVIIRANQTAGNYWFRADAENACLSFVRGIGRSIFTYQGQTVANPTSSALPGRPADCIDPKPTNKIAKNVPSSGFASQAQQLPVAFGNTTVASNGESLILWTVNGTSMM